ncbi:acyltransferase [Oerskovia turbata]|uniref:Acyltransferase n=1 Tax=Oerskovia turbata TaxID=1713 RepID=A0A4Q1KXL7_9CELL|nr:acyltransferase [Oerskovia turbata]RXR26727.1 acyltransferase [Oerskovia turbata]RXR34460.1 acyltransferase [Oerskovia turbata]TGJ97739.1 acyltransferase [Actinotalea fermentans ATCC 43279 = JCM 9966 = DSM 3133]
MPRADSLTGLRWWAAFGVFAFHMEVLAPLPINSLLQYGNFGVTFFFVLSGFVLTWSWSPRTDAPTFWWRRFARIYPSHLVALLLAIPVFYAVAPDPTEWWVKPLGPVLVLSFLLLQGWSRDPAILFSGNPAAWTLTCEAFFYAMHPALQRALRPFRVRGALVGAAVVIGVALSYRIATVSSPEAWWAADMPWPIVRITEFALGMCLAWAVRHGLRVRLTPWVGYGIVLGFLGWLAYATHLVPNPGTLTTYAIASANELATIACATAIVLVAGRDLRGGRSLLRSRVLVTLGEWSYAFYLVHATIVYFLRAQLGIFPVGWDNLLWYAITFVPALGAAAALHLLVEKPAERRMRRWWDDRRAAREDAVPPARPSASGTVSEDTSTGATAPRPHV